MHELSSENFECDLYIDTEEELAPLLQKIADLLNTDTIENSICIAEGSITLFFNSQFHKKYRKNLEDGFLFYRYHLKAKPLNLLGEENAVTLLSKILEFLWSNNVPAIAVCDYENELPNRGGYKNLSVPTPK